jgi:hypothetical protein
VSVVLDKGNNSNLPPNRSFTLTPNPGFYQSQIGREAVFKQGIWGKLSASQLRLCRPLIAAIYPQKMGTLKSTDTVNKIVYIKSENCLDIGL